MTGPMLWILISWTFHCCRMLSARAWASASLSPWEMKTTCSSGRMTVAFMWSRSARMERARPFAFSTGMRRPASSTWRTGLMESMVPTNAAAAETRPPRRRWLRSKTVNQWQTLPLFSSSQATFSARLMPASRLLSA